MQTIELTPFLAVAPQIQVSDLAIASNQGFKTVICARPDGEAEDQPNAAVMAAAATGLGLTFEHLPVQSGNITPGDVEAFQEIMAQVPGPVLCYCRTGTRSTTLWALSEAWHLSADAILRTTARAGYDLEAMRPRLEARQRTEDLAKGDAADQALDLEPTAKPVEVLIVGAGTAGLATASSILARRPDAEIVIVDPRDVHYYQPGWTLVGGGVFDRKQTERPMASLIPPGVRWVRAAVAGFEPQRNRIVLEDGTRMAYRALVVAPGLKLNWDGVEGLRDTLGKNGVTSNYLFDMAPYTWELVQSLKGGRAVFTQPPMPIKCAGAPQKAMYLSCDAWKRSGVLKNIDVEFYNAGGVLFGVPTYVPALMEYVQAYDINLQLNKSLIAVDGSSKTATIQSKDADGNAVTENVEFDMLHAVPPQIAPDFIRSSPLANDAGWVDVSPETLQHPSFGNIFSLGDVCAAPNAKTAAAVRKQAPVVAENVVSLLDNRGPRAVYDGYGSCPLTVERGKIVLAEFGYGGKLLPTFPGWMLDGTKPTRLAWFLKEKMLPWIYWEALLKGREWMLKVEKLPHQPAAHEGQQALTDAAPKAKAA